MSTETANEIPREILNLHPVAVGVAAVLEETPTSAEPFRFPSGIESELHLAMQNFAGQEELRSISKSLVALAFVLETQKRSPTAAKTILGVLNDPATIKLFSELPPPPPPPEESVHERAARLEQFTESVAIPKQAPTFDAVAPKGSIKLETLNPRRRG